MLTTGLNRSQHAEDSGLTLPVSDLGTGRAGFLLIASGLCFLSLLVFFREFLDSGFNLISGNVGDNRLLIAILEHWRAVCHGKAFFTSPNFYWPEHGVLGYSDSLFLFSPVYIIVRAAGLDSYIAFELTLILLKAVGFFSMLWLLRSFLRISRSIALVGSVLFTLSNLYFIPISVGHAQLVAVVFVPVLACFACAAWQANSRGQKNLARISATLFGLLLALVLFTSFYIGWFAIFAAAIAMSIVLVAQTLQARSSAPVRQRVHELITRGPILAISLFAFSIGIIPFALTYLPALKQMGGRSFSETLDHSAHPVDLLNVGRGNWIWGRSLDALTKQLTHDAIAPGERQTGWPPLTMALVTVGGLLGFDWRRTRNALDAVQRKRRFLAAVLSLSFIVCWSLSLDVGNQSLWWFIFKFVPGGSAIRVPARFNLVLNVFVVIIACLVLSELQKRGRAWRIGFGLMALFLVAEQINTASTHEISRLTEKAILGRVSAPPSSCASFFLAYPATPDRPFYANQIDAMLLARVDNIPTLNGYSGWTPPGWNFLTFGPGYFQNVRIWALDKHVTAGLCGLDLRTGSWKPTSFAVIPYSPGSMMDFRTGGNAPLYEREGWGEPEAGGSWTLGDRSVLTFNLPMRPQTDLVLTFRAHAFTPSQRPNFEETLRLNDSEVADWPITYSQPIIEKRLRLPQALFRSRLVRIEFLNHDPRSPAEFGLSIDGRKLGLAIESLKLEPVNSQADSK